jgi:hypothetical protein
MWYYWCSIILFSFSSFPEFHTVVPLLQTCPTTEFVYDHTFLCVCLLLDLSSTYERKHAFLEFWSWLTDVLHLPSKTPCHYLLWLSTTPLCICTTISWSIHQL